MPSASKILGDLVSSAGAISVTSGVANTAITGTITTAQIADSAITTPKIADASIVTVDIADANVTDAKIVGVANTKVTGRMTASQIANTAVTAGIYGGSSNSASITIDAQGRITAASNAAISSTPGAGSITDAMISTVAGGSFTVKHPLDITSFSISGGGPTFRIGVKIGRNISLQFGGSYSFSFSNQNENTSAYVYKNGVSQGTLVSVNNGGSGGPFTGSLTGITVVCSLGDVLQLYSQAGTGTGTVSNLVLLAAENTIPIFDSTTTNSGNI